MEEKRCIRCGEVKPVDAFYKHKRRSDGLTPECKECTKVIRRQYYGENQEKVRERSLNYHNAHREEQLERMRAYHAENRESERERNRTYRRMNPERVREQGRNYRAKNREKLLEDKRAYYAANRDEYLDHVRNYRASNSEKCRQISRAYREANKERIAEQQRAYREANADKKREYNHAYNAANAEGLREYQRSYRAANPVYARMARERRRSLLLEAEGTFTTSDITELYNSQSGCCAYCSQPLNAIYHIDHVMPLSRGGSNWPANLALTCAKCNLSKHDKLLYEEWQPPNPLTVREASEPF